MKKIYLKFLRRTYLFAIVSTIAFFLVLFPPVPAFAQNVDLQIPIGNTKSITVCSGGICYGIALYIVEFAKWFVGAITLLAVVAIMFGGLIWLTSRAEQKQVSFAKKLIHDSLIALGMTLGAYLILSIITPDLVNFKGLELDSIKNINWSYIDYTDPPPGSMTITAPATAPTTP